MGGGVNTVYLLFRALRPLNLFLIALTPLALWLVLVRPLPVTLFMDQRQVFMLGVALALVAGAGNVVNDIADRTIDRLNASFNPLNEGLPLSAAWTLYLVLNFIAALLTWQLAGDLDAWRYTPLLPLAIGSLIAYAFALKCLPWVGNVVVALLCASVPGILFLAEPALLSGISVTITTQSLVAYTGFAFFGTWSRELAKDLEDQSGDRAAGCRTLASVWPVSRYVGLVWICCFAAMACVAYLAGVWFRAEEFVLAGSWAALWLLLASIVANTHRAMSPKDAADLSRHLKLALGFGLLLLIFVGLPS